MAGETTYSTMCTAANGWQARGGIDATAIYQTKELATGELETADVIQMVKIPAGAVILEVILAYDDMDSGSALVLDVGDGDSTDRFIDGANAQSAGFTRMNNIAGVGHRYSSADTIDIIVQVAASTAVTGTVKLVVIYTMNKMPA